MYYDKRSKGAITVNDFMRECVMKNNNLIIKIIFSLFLGVYLLNCSRTSIFANAAVTGATTKLYTDKYYFIVSALDSNKVVDVSGGGFLNGTNIQLHTKNDTDAQLFKIVKSRDGYVTFINKGSKKAIDVFGAGTKRGTNIELWRKNNTKAQDWKIYKKGKCFKIKARCGKYMDVDGGRTKDGTNIQIWDKNGSKAQLFYFVPYERNTTKTVDLGNFNSLDEWKKSLEREERSLTFGGNLFTNPSGKTYYTGRIITGATILSYRKIKVKVSLNSPGYYTTKTLRLPKKIRFNLHKHNARVKMWFNFSYLSFWQQCECGYSDQWTWEIPYPSKDVSADGAWQNTDSVIQDIKPQRRVIGTVRQ